MWYYGNQIVTDQDIEGYYGFVYCITNLIDGRRYIGKKLLKFKKTKQVKGKRKHFLIDSDWQDYWSSSEELKADVEKLGASNFKREIIRLCKTKGEMTYYESKYLFEFDALLSDRWYNGWIYCRVRKSHLKSLSTTK